MKATYKLRLKQEQRRLDLTHKELNRLDRKHNDVNLLKQLQILNRVNVPPSGWYGTLTITNSAISNFDLIIISLIREDTNYEAVLNTTLQQGDPITLSLPLVDRFATPASRLKIKWDCASITNYSIYNLTGLTLQDYDVGYDPVLQGEVRANYIVDTAYNNNQVSIEIRLIDP